jgi:hypothetical protein
MRSRWRAEVVPPEFSEPYLQIMLDGLVAMNVLYLRAHPRTPPLYRAGIVYHREPPGRDEWATIPRVLEVGNGDCEDLAGWRTAELQRLGEHARAFPKLVRQNPDGTKLFHILVRRGNGTVEDPSRKLGMGAEHGA